MYDDNYARGLQVKFTEEDFSEARSSDDIIRDRIGPEKLAKMIEYTKVLRKKHPTMKEDRVKRKVAEYFKVKLT